MITLNKVFTVPLQRGLHFYIDGQEVPLLRVNSAFAGAALDAGQHTVELRLTPPGKRLGLCISVLSFGLTCCHWRRHRI